MPMNENIPNNHRLMTIREIAATGVIPETALRRLVAEKKVPFVSIGRKKLINYGRFLEFVEKGGAE